MIMMLMSVISKTTARGAAAPRYLRFLSTDATDKMYSMFNSQITNEFKASQLYLSAMVWCEEKELTGMASYMFEESMEERNHGLEMVKFGLKRDFPIELEAIPAPHAHWESTEDLWSDLLEAEKTNTDALYGLADAAQACQDHALTTFLQPFHTEQVDAVDHLKTILAKVREEKQTPGLIRQLDTEIGAQAGGK